MSPDTPKPSESVRIDWVSWKPSTEIPPPGGIIRLAITGPTFKRGEYFALPIGGGRAAAFRVTWASRDGSALTARRVDGMPSEVDG